MGKRSRLHMVWDALAKGLQRRLDASQAGTSIELPAEEMDDERETVADPEDDWDDDEDE